MIDLNEMMIFTKVVEAGTFTAAAKALGLPKSTVSRKIAQTEARLGVRLLHRTTRSVKPTELGAAHYERCSRIISDVEDAERVLAHGQSTPRGLLRVSIPVETGLGQFGSLMAEFLRLHPHIRIELDVSNRLVDIVEEGFDLAIRAGSMPDSSLIARRLASSSLMVCVSPEYLKTHEKPRTPQDLRDHECGLYGAANPVKSFQFKGASGIANITVAGRLAANSMGVLLAATLAGLGVGLIPRGICKQHLEDGTLVQLLSDWKLPDGGVYAVYPSPRHLTPKVRAFIDFLADRLDF